MKKLILSLVVSACWIGLGQQANAFTGTVQMGSSNAKNNVKVTHPTATSTHVDFLANWKVFVGDGVYSSSANAVVTYTDFTYTTATGAITSPVVTPFTLWTFSDGTDTFTFKLDNPVTPNPLNSSTFFQLTGTGTGYVNGGDATAGTWSLTGNSTGAKFSFTATSVNTFLPDGGSAVALLGIALAGIEGLRRKIGARKA